MSGADHEGRRAQRRLDLRAFRANIAAMLRWLRHGRSVLLTAHEELPADIRPLTKTVRPRRNPGALTGQIRMADDFDTLPPKVLAAMDRGDV